MERSGEPKPQHLSPGLRSTAAAGCRASRECGDFLRPPAHAASVTIFYETGCLRSRVWRSAPVVPAKRSFRIYSGGLQLAAKQVSMRIVLCYPVEPQHIARIQSAWPEAELVDAGQERIAAELPSADIYCGHAKVPVPWDEVVAGGRLQWIQSSAAGLDHCLVPSVVDSSHYGHECLGGSRQTGRRPNFCVIARDSAEFADVLSGARRPRSSSAARPATSTEPASALSASAAMAGSWPGCSRRSSARSSPPIGFPNRNRPSSTKSCRPTPSTSCCRASTC